MFVGGGGWWGWGGGGGGGGVGVGGGEGGWGWLRSGLFLLVKRLFRIGAGIDGGRVLESRTYDNWGGKEGVSTCYTYREGRAVRGEELTVYALSGIEKGGI